MRAIRIGITGKLGSGKSLMIKAMEARGFFCIRSDDLAREMMERDPSLRTELIGILGPNAYSNGTLDRKFVASKIFSDRTADDRSSALRKQVEALVHPAVTAEIERIFEAHPGEMVAVESALILQSRFQERFDYIILIESPDAEAIARVTQDGRISKADAEARLAEQINDAIARDEADFIVENSDTKASFEKKCEKLLDVLEALRNRELPEEPLHAE